MDFDPKTTYQSQTSHIYDLGELDDLRRDALSQDKAALRKVAQRFESIFLSMMLKSMRDANQYFEEDNPLNTRYTKFYRDMHDQQMAQDLSRQGVLGLADLIVQQMAPDYETYKPASILQGAREYQAPQTIPVIESMRDAAQKQDATELSQLVLETKALQATEGRSALCDNPQDFIQKFLPHARRAAKKLDTDPAVLLAQAALETGWGQQVLQKSADKSSHNLFNIKADPSWKGERTRVKTLEFEQGAMRQKSEYFRAYDSVAESFDDYASFLKEQPRYQQALMYADRPRAFISHLHKAGYASDPQYIKKVMRVMAHILDKL